MSSTWLQLESIAKVLDVFPAVFLAGLVAHGLLGKIGLARKAGAYLGRPFRGFLYEEDLAEYSADDPRPPKQSWKTVFLAVVAAALASIWIYTAAFDTMSGGGARKDIQLSVVTAATWVILASTLGLYATLTFSIRVDISHLTPHHKSAHHTTLPSPCLHIVCAGVRFNTHLEPLTTPARIFRRTRWLSCCSGCRRYLPTAASVRWRSGSPCRRCEYG